MTSARDDAAVRSRRLLVSAWACWSFGLAAYAYGVLTGFTLSPDGLSDEAERRSLVGLGVGLGLTVGASAGGFLLAASTGRRLAAATLGVAVLLSLVPAAYLGPGLAREWRDRVTPEPTPTGPRGCVVLSGGSNTCPGG